jgi:hypothetical protein
MAEENVRSEINAIKFILETYNDFEQEERRLIFLRSRAEVVPSLKLYLRFTENELKSVLFEKEKLLLGKYAGI